MVDWFSVNKATLVHLMEVTVVATYIHTYIAIGYVVIYYATNHYYNLITELSIVRCECIYIQWKLSNLYVHH